MSSNHIAVNVRILSIDERDQHKEVEASDIFGGPSTMLLIVFKFPLVFLKVYVQAIVQRIKTKIWLG